MDAPRRSPAPEPRATTPAAPPTTPPAPALGRSTAIMAMGTLASRLTGLGRNVAFAALTAGVVTDTYLVANTTPNLVYELVIGGVLSSTLVPLFVELVDRADHGDRRARNGISAIVTLSLAAVVALSIFLFFGASFLIDHVLMQGSPPLERQVGAALLRMFAPQVAIYGGITLGTALLNARRRFGAPMLAPVLNNLVVIVVFVWAGRVIASLAKAAGVGSGANDQRARLALIAASGQAKLLLGVGTTAGVLAMGLALLPAVRSAHLPVRFHWAPSHPAVRKLIALSGWTIGYVAANQVALVFVIRAAQRGVDGDVTAYNLANTTFFLLPHGVIAVSLITALQPELAKSFVDRARGRFRRQLNHGIRSICVAMVPAAFGYLVLARPVVDLVLGRKAGRTADALWPMAIGLPGFSVYLLFMAALKAMRDTRATFEVNILENAINIVAAALLFAPLGVRGLALSYSVAYTASAFIAGVVVARRTAGLGAAQLVSSIGRTVAASAAMAVAVLATSKGFDHVLFPGGRVPGRSARLLVEVVGSVGVGVTVYVFAGRVVGLSELSGLVEGLRRRLRRADR